jgi:hypothetical protein
MASTAVPMGSRVPVVVVLEAVEVEDGDEHRPLVGEDLVEVAHQLAPVAEARDGVDERLALAGREDVSVVAEGESEPDDDREECEDIERARDVVDRVDELVGLQADGDEAKRDRHGEHASFELLDAQAGGRLPGRQGR